MLYWWVKLVESGDGFCPTKNHRVIKGLWLWNQVRSLLLDDSYLIKSQLMVHIDLMVEKRKIFKVVKLNKISYIV